MQKRNKTKIMALDFGTKRIGIAVSDPLGITAQGLCVINREGKKKTLRKIRELVEEQGVEQFLMGLPLKMSGREGTLYQDVLKFGKSLEVVFSIPVAYADERLTSIQAERVLLEADISRAKRVKVIDKMAAQLILQNHLDSMDKEQRDC